MKFREQLRSVLDVAIKSVKDRTLWASEDTMLARLEICENCDKIFKPAGRRWKCKRCGCQLQKKVAVQASECPLGKW